MRILGIKGHSDRGDDVIRILESLGGNNCWLLEGAFTNNYYYINEEGDISDTFDKSGFIKHFTLEEFEEKFPFKKGDSVMVCDYESPVRIVSMEWNGSEIEYGCIVDDEIEKFLVEEIVLSEKNKNMNKSCECKKTNIDVVNFNNGDYADEVKLNFEDEYSLETNDRGTYLVRKKKAYPKTVDECLDVLGKSFADIGDIKGFKATELIIFQQLLLCREAYMKILGEDSSVAYPFAIIFDHESKRLSKVNHCWNRILSFPDEEVRDIFFENFSNLI